MSVSIRLACTVVAGICCALPRAAVGAQGSANQSPHVVATGVGEARVVPDRATMFVGVQSRATTAAAAAADNARRQRAVLDTLRSLGLASDQLSTTNFSVSPEMQYATGGQTPPRVTGYTVSNTVRLEIRRLDDVGRLLDAALAKGANNMSGLQFYSSKADSARRVALAAAVANARADADAMARAGGGALGPLLELSSGSTQAPRPMDLSARMAPAMAAPTPIEPGEQVISAAVTVVWSFVGSR